MAKIKTSENYKHLFSEKKYTEINGELFQEQQPLEWLLNEDNILASLAESVKKKDLKAALETLHTYEFARKTARKIAKARAEELRSNSQAAEDNFVTEQRASIGYSFSGNSSSKY